MKKPNRILILHGWEGDPSLYWIPKAKTMLESKGYEVHAPQMPGGYFPKKEPWLKIIKDLRPDENWILIGHSLGGVAILKYLEETNQKVAKTILIATPFEPMKFNPIANFFEGGFDWQKIKENCPKFTVLNELNDPVVPADHAKKYAEALGVAAQIVAGGTHFHVLDLNLLLKIIATK